MGRVSYQAWFDFWPSQRNSESQFYAAFSRYIDGVEKIVVSNTLTATEWENSRVIGGDMRSEIAELKRHGGNDIAIVGGAEVARTLGGLQVIDEYCLWVRPVILGSGTKLFDTASNPASLNLIAVKTFSSGLLGAPL